MAKKTAQPQAPAAPSEEQEKIQLQAQPQSEQSQKPEQQKEPEPAAPQLKDAVLAFVLYATQIADKFVFPGDLISLTRAQAEELQKTGDVDLSESAIAHAQASGKTPISAE